MDASFLGIAAKPRADLPPLLNFRVTRRPFILVPVAA